MDEQSTHSIGLTKTANTEGGNANEIKLNDDQDQIEEEGPVHHEEIEGKYGATEYLEGEQVKEHLKEEHIENEKLEGEYKEKVTEDEEILAREGLEGSEMDKEEKKEEPKVEEVVEEEEAYLEEPPTDPTAPFNFSDSTEALKEPFKLRPEQLAEVEQLWEYFQNYTPAYTDIDNYITDKELIYMLKALLLMTVTEEQFYELVTYCVRPPHPKGHINFDQFVKIVTIRQRDTPIEDELRCALQVLDPEKTGSVDRENLKDLLAKQGYKMPQRHLDNLIKEVDMSNDGTLGIEDIIGTMCIDLNKEDLQLLLASVYPPDGQPPLTEEG